MTALLKGNRYGRAYGHCGQQNTKPKRPADGSGDAAIALYKRTLRDFAMLEKTAPLFITNNVIDEMLGLFS